MLGANSKIQIPPSTLKHDLVKYRAQLTGSLLDEAERRAVDRLLERVELIDWYSMSNFWMHFLQPKKPGAWRCTSNSQSLAPYLRAALRTLQNPDSDCFLQFMVEVEYRCRFYILQSDVCDSTVPNTVTFRRCAPEWVISPVVNFLNDVSGASFHQKFENFVEASLQATFEALRTLKRNCVLTFGMRSQLRLKRHSEAQKRGEAAGGSATANLSHIAEGDKTAHVADKVESVENSSVVSDVADAQESLSAEEQEAKKKWLCFVQEFSDKSAALLELANTIKGKESTAFYNFVDEWGGDALASIRPAEEPSCAPQPHQRRPRGKNPRQRRGQVALPEKEPTQVELDALCQNTLQSFDLLLKTFHQCLTIPQYQGLTNLFETYGLTDSEEKLRKIYQLDGRAKCVVGEDFEDNIVLHYLPTLCDVIAESYSFLKGVDVAVGRSWLRHCLCPPTAEEDDGDSERPDLPRLLHCTGTSMRSLFELKVSAAPASPLPPLLESSITVGEYDLLLLEETSLDVLFCFEVKNNCADIEKAGRQKEKLFHFLDAAWRKASERVSSPPASNTEEQQKPSAPETFLELQARIKRVTKAKKPYITTHTLTEKNFIKYFSHRERRIAQFVMVTTLPEQKMEPGALPKFFPSTGKLRTLLMRLYADEVAKHIMDQIFLLMGGQQRPALIDYFIRSLFPSPACLPPPETVLQLPLQLREVSPSETPNSLPSEVQSDAVQQAIYLKTHSERSDNAPNPSRNLRLVHPIPEYPIVLRSCPSDTNFKDVIQELIKQKSLRTLYII